jgi:hypothetical protein
MTNPTTSYHAGRSCTLSEPQANRRAPIALTPTQVRLRTFGGKPARSCRSSLYVCNAIETCDNDEICREHGEILKRSSQRNPLRCDSCYAEPIGAIGNQKTHRAQAG